LARDFMPFNTRETVAMETPARSATACMPMALGARANFGTSASGFRSAFSGSCKLIELVSDRFR
jgi:hypothetical protein